MSLEIVKKQAMKNEGVRMILPAIVRNLVQRGAMPAVIAAGLLSTGCPPPPVPLEMTESQSLLDAAVEQGAPELAPQLYQDALSYQKQATEAYEGRDIDEARNLAVLARLRAMAAASSARTLTARKGIETANQNIMIHTQAREKDEAQLEKVMLSVTRMERILKAESENRQKDAEVALRDAKEALGEAERKGAAKYAKAAYDEALGQYKLAEEAYAAGEWERTIDGAGIAATGAKAAQDLAASDYKQEKAKEGLRNKNDEVFNRVAKIETVEARRKKDGIIVITWNLFQTGSEEVDPERAHILDTIAGVLADYPAYQVVVEGHTDNTGSKAINLALSTARAQSVKDYFVNKKNLPSGRFTATGYGSERPLASNDDPKGRQKNRRVEIVLLYPQ